MSFSSIIFCFIFLPIVTILYFLIPKKIKTIYLLIISIIFYSYGGLFNTFILLLIVLYNFISVKIMDNLKDKDRKYKLIEILIINIFTLCYFKYYYILLNNIFSNISFKQIILPLGMSFYLFTVLSYVIDVYRQKIKCESNFIKFSLYILFFPKLIMGPIVRYSDFNKQIDNLNNNLFNYGFKRFIIGLSMKIILADTFSRIISTISINSMFSSLILMILYSLQIYYDFAGYTNMALGLSNIFGFEFEENFNYPYLSKSVGEFFRRWHITLGSWFKDYVYIPLGGSRVSKIKLIRNLLIVWILTGMWHGANLNFILWGLFLGIIIVLEKLVFNKININEIFKILITFFLMSISWVFFFNSNLNDIIIILKNLFNFACIIDKETYFIVKNNIVYLLLGLLFLTPLLRNIGYVAKTKFNYTYNILNNVCLFVLLLLSTAYLISYSYQTFLYFNF